MQELHEQRRRRRRHHRQVGLLFTQPVLLLLTKYTWRSRGIPVSRLLRTVLAWLNDVVARWWLQYSVQFASCNLHPRLREHQARSLQLFSLAGVKFIFAARTQLVGFVLADRKLLYRAADDAYAWTASSRFPLVAAYSCVSGRYCGWSWTGLWLVLLAAAQAAN